MREFDRRSVLEATNTEPVVLIVATEIVEASVAVVQVPVVGVATTGLRSTPEERVGAGVVEIAVVAAATCRKRRKTE